MLQSSKVNIESTANPVSSLPTDNKSVYDLFKYYEVIGFDPSYDGPASPLY